MEEEVNGEEKGATMERERINLQTEKGLLVEFKEKLKLKRGWNEDEGEVMEENRKRMKKGEEKWKENEKEGDNEGREEGKELVLIKKAGVGGGSRGGLGTRKGRRGRGTRKNLERGLVEVQVISERDMYNGLKGVEEERNEEERMMIKNGGGGWPITAIR